MEHKALSIRPFVGAADFGISRSFYRDLGFEEVALSPKMSLFKTGSFGFYLQDAFVRDWIDNTMLFLEVEDVELFWDKLVKLDLDSKYKNVRLTPIRTEQWGRECFVHDPSGVLWHFGEFFAKKAETTFSKLVPNVFYTNIHDAMPLFVDCLGFEITHDEIRTRNPFCVIEKDGLRINLFQNEKLAREHNPEFHLVTEDIESVYQKVVSGHPHLLHPNLNKVTLRPWGAKEFAVTDMQLGIVIQQWKTDS